MAPLCLYDTFGHFTQVIPNRDAMPYASLYDLDDAATVFRGTLRYAGWGALFAELRRMGAPRDSMLRLRLFPSSSCSAPLPLCVAPSPRFLSFSLAISSFCLPPGLTVPNALPAGASTWPELLHALGIPDAPAAGDSEQTARAISSLRWLGAFEPGTPLGATTDTRDAFCALLETKLGYADDERDAVYLEHTFGVTYDDGRPNETISSSLIGFGDPGGTTCMSKTVGLTSAIGLTRVMDQGAAPLAGVLAPTERSVYEYALAKLAEEGLGFLEDTKVG